MRVLITRPLEKSAEFADILIKAGVEPVVFPVIEIRPVDDPIDLDDALSRLDRFAWLVFTSGSAVRVVLDRLKTLGIQSLPVGLQIAAVGPQTANLLEDHGIVPDFVPEQYVSEALIPGMGDLRGTKVLLPTADIAPDTLSQAITRFGGIPERVTAYRTLPAQPDEGGLAELKSGVDVVTFASGSAVKNFIALVKDARMDPLDLPGNPVIACIGSKTAQIARELGFDVDIISKIHTASGLADALQAEFITQD